MNKIELMDVVGTMLDLDHMMILGNGVGDDKCYVIQPLRNGLKCFVGIGECMYFEYPKEEYQDRLNDLGPYCFKMNDSQFQNRKMPE